MLHVCIQPSVFPRTGVKKPRVMPDSPEVGAWHGEVLWKVDDGAAMDADGLLKN